MRQPYRTALFASLILIICAGMLWAAYDWFQGRYLRAFSEHTAVFSGDPLKLPANLAGPGPIRLVHFWDPTCPCNVGNQQHLGELIEQYAPQGSSSTPCKTRQPRPIARQPAHDENPHRPSRRRAGAGQPGRRHLGSQRQARVFRALQRRPHV